MARPAKLKQLALLLGLVLVAHAVGLHWVARHLEPVSVMKAMAPPMLTRMIAPETPKPAVVVAATPAPRPRPRSVAVRPRPAASAPVEVASQPSAPAIREPVVAPVQTSPAVTAAAPASAPSTAAAPPQAAASAATGPPLDTWPVDTRLSYQLGGVYRNGELYGDARVQWQREGNRYQVRIDVDVTLFVTMVITSQGDVTPEGLMPRAYEEVRTGKRRAARFGDEMLALENGKTAPRPPGMQDAASQFVELAHRFATGGEKLEVGKTVSVWLARPGGVDLWVYDIVEREVLQTPNLGPVEAFRLKPRLIAKPRGNLTVEMWFAPSLQYLPVRVKLLMGPQDYIDLMVDRIEQK